MKRIGLIAILLGVALTLNGCSDTDADKSASAQQQPVESEIKSPSPSTGGAKRPPSKPVKISAGSKEGNAMLDALRAGLADDSDESGQAASDR